MTYPIQKSIITKNTIGYSTKTNFDNKHATPLDVVIKEKENGKRKIQSDAISFFFYESCFFFGLLTCIHQLRKGMENDDAMMGLLVLSIVGCVGAILCFMSFLEKFRFYRITKPLTYNISIISASETNNALKFCRENTSGNWKSIDIYNFSLTGCFSHGAVFSFENETDAAAFKTFFG